MSDLDTFLALYGLAAIFAVMLLKAAGVPIPIPSDVIMLAVAAGAANQRLVLWQAFLAILLALILGGLLQFALVRGPGRAVVYRLGPYIGLNRSRLDAAAAVLQRRGFWALGLAMLTPGVRAGAVAACGLAGTPFRTFLPALLLASTAFLALHFLLGYVGAALLGVLSEAVPLRWVLGVLVAAFLGAVGAWIVIRRRQLPRARRRDVAVEVLGAWQEAACPACLVWGASQRLLGAPVDLGASLQRGRT